MYKASAAVQRVSPQVLAFAYVALVGVVALVLAVLHRFARLFGNYARGQIFTRASVRELRLVGYLAVANAVFQGVLFIVALLLAAEGAVESPASLRADFPFGPILVAGLVLLLSWVMDVGAGSCAKKTSSRCSHGNHRESRRHARAAQDAARHARRAGGLTPQNLSVLKTVRQGLILLLDAREAL